MGKSHRPGHGQDARPWLAPAVTPRGLNTSPRGSGHHKEPPETGTHPLEGKTMARTGRELAGDCPSWPCTHQTALLSAAVVLQPPLCPAPCLPMRRCTATGPVPLGLPVSVGLWVWPADSSGDPEHVQGASLADLGGLQGCRANPAAPAGCPAVSLAHPRERAECSWNTGKSPGAYTHGVPGSPWGSCGTVFPFPTPATNPFLSRGLSWCPLPSAPTGLSQWPGEADCRGVFHTKQVF